MIIHSMETTVVNKKKTKERLKKVRKKDNKNET